jgi:hypothetical protein
MDEALCKLEERLRLLRPKGETTVLESALEKLVRQSIHDPDQLERLRLDPGQCLGDLGIALSPEQVIHLHQEVAGEAHLVLPLGEIHREDLTPEIIRILARAKTDLGFAASLVEDPRRTIEEEFHWRLPGSVQIFVHQNQVNCLHVVLPWDSPTGELTDQELDLVAGAGPSPVWWRRIVKPANGVNGVGG